jgi:hypothetical protein
MNHMTCFGRAQTNTIHELRTDALGDPEHRTELSSI